MSLEKTPRGRVLVIGGSLIGLLAGNLLLRAGWDVTIFERIVDNLEGRGAGITILPGLVSAFRAAGADVSEQSLGIELPARLALDRAGRVVAEREFAQTMTSWGSLYESLKHAFPAERYRRGMTLERVEQTAGKAIAVFTNGERIAGDLLVGADGYRSAIRAQFLPQAKASYAGYVAWRCLADEADLPGADFATLFERYAVCVAPGEQGIGYPVPGPGHSKRPGHRQYNVVWYHPFREHDELPRLMTDDSGRYHANGIPPALLSARVRQEMIDRAQQVLAPQFALALKKGRLHFFQPIMDLDPPRLSFGRVALVGDAAFITRPHVAMGVPKGAGDVIELLRALDQHGADFTAALAQFDNARLRVGRAITARSRYLGAYMAAQLGSESERQQAEAQRDAEQVMMETAAPIDYEALA